MPKPRSGHSAAIYKDNELYIFGGKDDDDSKLDDLWVFDIQNRKWEQITDELDGTSVGPSPRSGHTASIHGDSMVIFAGIFEITKELNDAFIFDFATKKWSMLFSKQMNI